MAGIPVPFNRNDLLASRMMPSMFNFSATTGVDSTPVHAQRSQPQVACLWPDIQGVNSWEGLLDPMNPVLKAEILRYGEFAELCYDAFDDRHYSEYYGTCKYSKRSLFEKMGFSNSGYQVTKYIYANTQVLGSFFGERSSDGVWIGFIAVCTDPNELKRLGRRDIVIAWRGTSTMQEWVEDLKDVLITPALLHGRSPATSSTVNVPESPAPNVRIEKGFMDCYTSMDEESKKCSRSARDIVVGEIKRLLEEYKGEKLSITLTGHSLGAALATLSAYDIKDMANTRTMEPAIPVTVFAFASPRVGNPSFALRMEEIGVKVLRLVNKQDLVPTVPGYFMNENLGWLSKLLNWLPWTYSHVGVQVSLDIQHSPFLKRTHNLAHFHSLEVYLHLLDGFVGKNQPFKSSGRDTALVNKSCDLLMDALHIPSYWWQERNKGLIRSADGKWAWPARSPRSPDADYDPHVV